MLQWVKNPALPQLWQRLQLQFEFDSWPRNFHVPGAQQKKGKEKKPKEKKKRKKEKERKRNKRENKRKEEFLLWLSGNESD